MIRARVLFPELPPEHETIRVAWAEVRHTTTRLTVFLTSNGEELQVTFTAPDEQTPLTVNVISLPSSLKGRSYGTYCGPLNAYSDLVRAITPQTLKEQMEHYIRYSVEVLKEIHHDAKTAPETPSFYSVVETASGGKTCESLREFYRTYTSNRYNCRAESVYPVSFAMAGVLTTKKPSVDRTGFALLTCHPLTRKALREGNTTGTDVIADYPLQSDRKNAEKLVSVFRTLKKTVSAYAYGSHLVKKYRELLDNLNQSRKPVIVQCRYRPEVVHTWVKCSSIYPQEMVIAPIPVEVVSVSADGVDVPVPPDLLDCLYVLGESVRFMANAVNGMTPHPLRVDVSEDVLVAVACRQLEYIRYPPCRYMSGEPDILPLLTTVYPAAEVMAEINGYRRVRKVCRLARKLVRETILTMTPYHFNNRPLLEVLEDSGTKYARAVATAAMEVLAKETGTD